MQGQVAFIAQHWRGDPLIVGKEGWLYQVYVKESPDSLVPYHHKSSV
jgi:hypothetical protein